MIKNFHLFWFDTQVIRNSCNMILDIQSFAIDLHLDIKHVHLVWHSKSEK